jgi:hypothetical protein
MPIDFVTPVAFLGQPTGPTKVISGKTLGGLTQNDVFFVGIVGDGNNVVKTVSADVPNAVTIEDAGVVGGIRWFRLSRARVNNATIQAKDAKGTVVASVLLDIVLVPTSSRPKDFVVDPADPKHANQTNLRVYAPKDDPDYVDTRMTGVGNEIYLHNGFQLFCTVMNIPTTGIGCRLSRRRRRLDQSSDRPNQSPRSARPHGTKFAQDFSWAISSGRDGSGVRHRVRADAAFPSPCSRGTD